MEQAGVHVVHGFPDLKIHAKMTLVIRREDDGLRRYAHIGTGNYNASTARIYEDVGLFTADEEISADVADLFNYLTGFGRPQRFRKLLVAPFTMRARLVEDIRARRGAAAAGQPTRIRLKLNALVDPTIVEELYAASAAGVPIEIQRPRRSACSSRGRGPLGDDPRHRRSSVASSSTAGSPGSRPADETNVYTGSADLMPRNLDRRIEVLTPVENARAKAEIGAHPRQRVRGHDEHLGARPRRRVDPARRQGQEGATPTRRR